MSAENPLKETESKHQIRTLRSRFGGFAEPLQPLIAAQNDADQALERILASDAIDRIIAKAPILVGLLPSFPELFSTLFEETWLPNLSELPLDCAPTRTAHEFEKHRLFKFIQFTLRSGDAAPELGSLFEDLLNHIHRRLQLSFNVLATGAFASGDLGQGKHAEIVLQATADDFQRNDLEAHAFLGFLEGLSHYGMTSKIEIKRLNNSLFLPEGGLSSTEVANLSPGEYVTITSARPIIGQPERIADTLPLRPERLRSLVAFKRQIETQLVSMKYRRRDVLDGEGGLSDISWLLLLNEGRYPTATGWSGVWMGADLPEPAHKTEDRLRNLARAQLLLPTEFEALTLAQTHLAAVLMRIFLLGIDDRIVPENPDKLAALAKSLHYADANDFLRVHEMHIDNVRSIFLDSLDRLRA